MSTDTGRHRRRAPARTVPTAGGADRIAIVAVVLVGIGATLWLWPSPDITTQVGPRLPTVSAPPNATGAIQPTPAITTGSTGRQDSAPTNSTANAATTSSTGHPRSAGQHNAASPAALPPARRTATDPTPTADPTPAPSTRPPAGPTLTPAGSTHPLAAPILEAAPAPMAAAAAGAPGPAAVPAVLTVPFPSSNHPNGVSITVMPHGPAVNGDMWIPGPEEGISGWANAVSWLNTPGYAAPFSTHGAVIIAGHINWQGTSGALSDLSEYGANDIGKNVTVSMTDGRVRSYRITQGFTIDKAQLASENNQGPLHTIMFGQTGSYGPAGHPGEELRLISCGGQYDVAARSYNSNVIIIAQPVS